MEKKKVFMPKKNLLFSLFVLSISFLISCNGKESKNEKTTSNTTGEKKDTSDVAAAAAAANISFPIFRIDRGDLIIPHGKKPTKLIIKFKFSNFGNPLNTVSLLLYSAKGHPDYGSGDDPVEILQTQQGFKSIQKAFVVGNLEIDFGKLLKPGGALEDFSYLILTPNSIKYTDGQGRKHLIFEVEAFDANNVSLTKALTIPPIDTNPSPPAPPGQ